MTRQPITRLQFLSQLLCPSLYMMMVLMVVEALLAAATTYFIIKAGRDVADDEFLVADLLWILARAVGLLCGGSGELGVRGAGGLSLLWPLHAALCP